MQIFLANQANFRIGSHLFKLGSSQITKNVNREFSSVLMLKPPTDRIKSNEKHILLKSKIQRVYIEPQALISFSWFGWKSKSANNSEVVNETSASLNKDESPTSIGKNETSAFLSKDDNASALYENTGYIPEPPPIFDENLVLNALGEPTLQSLGLGCSYTPVGWVQLILEFFHVSLGLPWYVSIVLFGVLMRVTLLPVTIKSQRNAMRMKKLGPISDKIREKMNDAKMTGDTMKMAQATQDYMNFMKSNNLGFGSMMLPMIQIPVFITTFLAIKRMCNLPVDSLTNGGILWFTDLSLTDPTYILPTLSVLSIVLIVYRGIETGVDIKNMSPIAKVAVFGASAISFPFMIFMPSGLMVYFCTTNAFSLMMSILTSLDSVKRAFKIPILSANELREIKESSKKKGNFLDGFKESISNQKIIQEVNTREELRDRKFREAGLKVPERTFKTKPNQKSN